MFLLLTLNIFHTFFWYFYCWLWTSKFEIWNKFEILVQQVTNNADILISETKLDNSFPEGQFLIPGYSSTYRFDRNCQGGGIMLYVMEDIPSKLLSIEN